jgi:hypothetical protein
MVIFRLALPEIINRRARLAVVSSFSSSDDFAAAPVQDFGEARGSSTAGPACAGLD